MGGAHGLTIISLFSESNTKDKSSFISKSLITRVNWKILYKHRNIVIREPGFLCKEGKVEPKIKATDESMDKNRATFMHERQKAIMCVITNIHHS